MSAIEQAARVLAEHPIIWLHDDTWGCNGPCGWVDPGRHADTRGMDAHCAHQAQALADAGLLVDDAAAGDLDSANPLTPDPEAAPDRRRGASSGGRGDVGVTHRSPPAELLAEHGHVKFESGRLWCACGALLWTLREGFVAGRLEMRGSVGETAHTHHLAAALRAAGFTHRDEALAEVRERLLSDEVLERVAVASYIGAGVETTWQSLAERHRQWWRNDTRLALTAAADALDPAHTDGGA